MTLEVVGAGVGRTGTYTLKLALEQLGFGPCHHMEAVLKDAARQVPLWSAAAAGTPDWEATFKGYNSAVDWPTAAFWRELAAAYPGAKIVLTTRNAECWYQSYSETIAKLMSSADQAPAHLKPWFKMASAVTARSGIGGKTNRDDVIRAFEVHAEEVRTAVPANRLLVYEVRDGWEPLCAFLEKPVPATPFPNTNNREEFWDLARKGLG
jgi:hypothetical protein